MLVFDQKARDISLQGPEEFFKQYFLNIPIPCGIIEICYDEVTGAPNDIIMRFANVMYSQTSWLAHTANLSDDFKVSDIIGKKMGVHFGVAKDGIELLASSFHKIIETNSNHAVAMPSIHDRCFFVQGFPIDPEKKLVGFVSEHSIHNEKKLAEKEEEIKRKSLALETAEQRFERLCKSNIIGIMVCKFSGELVFVNDRFLEIIGYSREDVESGRLEWHKLTPVEWHHDDYNIHIGDTINKGSCGPYEKEFYSKSGERVPIEIAGALGEYDPDDIPNSTCISYIIDLRPRKKAEQALILAREEALQAKEEAINASKSKSNFLSTMSHELRTPLAGILGAQTLLAETSLDPEQKDLVDSSIRSGQGLLSLLGDVLDLSKIEAGKVTLNMAPFDLREAVEESVMLVGELASKKGLELVVYFDDSTLLPPPFKSDHHALLPASIPSCQLRAKQPIMVVSDMLRLRQIIINLVGNSIKFTETGGVLIKVSILPQSQQVRRLSWDAPIQVIDSHNNSNDHSASSSSRKVSFSDSSNVASAASAVSSSSSPKSPSFSSSSERYIDPSDCNPNIPIVPMPQQQVVSENASHIRRVLIEVSDTGLGIAEAKQKMLFKPFTQIESGGNRRFEGAGLGLSICRQLLALLGGSIGIFSHNGSGSTFFFDLPVTLVDESQPADASDGASADINIKVVSAETVVPAAAASEVQDPLHDIHCLVLDGGRHKLCSCEAFLHKNSIASTSISPDAPDLLDRLKSAQYDALLVCLHNSTSSSFRTLEKIAHEAVQGDSSLQYYPICMFGTREAISSRKQIAGIKTLRNVVTAFKPLKESACLSAIARALLKYKSVGSLVRSSSRSASASSDCSSGSEEASSRSPTDPSGRASSLDDLSSHLELYRMANHIHSEQEAKLGGALDDEAEEFIAEPLPPPQPPLSVQETHDQRRRRSLTYLSDMEVAERPDISLLVTTRINNSHVCEDVDADLPPSLLAPDAEASSQKQGRIDYMLIAEDNPLLAKVAKKQMETKLPAEGVTIQVVENGEDAVIAAEQYMIENKRTIPLIWMDVMMPKKDGLEASRDIRRLEKLHGFHDPRQQSYIAALTADAMSETSSLCIDSGMNEKLTKPMNVQTLLEVYQRACVARGHTLT